MAIEFASGTSSVGPSPSVIAGLTEAVLQCSRLREATVLTELAARMLNEAMERLEERDALPLNSHPDRSRHAMAEALGLWRAAWTLCSTHLADRSGMLGVLQTIDQAGASLAGGEAGSIPRLAVAASALRRFGHGLRTQLDRAAEAVERLGYPAGLLPDPNLTHEAARLRALQRGQNCEGRVAGSALLLPDEATTQESCEVELLRNWPVPTRNTPPMAVTWR
jgi:hypothetical protein